MRARRDEPLWQRRTRDTFICPSGDRRRRETSARLPEHHAPNRIAIQVLAGRLRIAVPGQSIDLNAGSLLTLEGGQPHDVEALEESASLLTIAWHGVGAPTLDS